jgi:hypothetical protein
MGEETGFEGSSCGPERQAGRLSYIAPSLRELSVPVSVVSGDGCARQK